MSTTGPMTESLNVIDELIGLGLWSQAEQLCWSTISISGESPQVMEFLRIIQQGKLNSDDRDLGFDKAATSLPDNSASGCNRFRITDDTREASAAVVEEQASAIGPRVLLINPHETEQSGFTNPPLGLLYIAGTLIKHGYNVRVTDGCLEGKGAITDAIRTFSPQIVGITCLTPGRKRALEVARMVKDHDASTKVIMGGAHPTIMFRQMLLEYSDLIDYVVLGEGELSFLEIVQGKERSGINGIAYLENGKVVKTSHRNYVENLDDLAFPAWHLIDLHRYPARGPGMFRGIDLTREPRISVIFSRGCTGHCSFCSTWWIWQGWRHRSAVNMVDELELLYTKYNIRHFAFADDTLTADREATIQLCDEIISRKLHIAFHVTTRTDCVDEEVLNKLSQAGCYNIAFGIETGSPTLLQKVGKENDIEHSERAILLARQAGIIVTALIMVGNMGETEETVQETIDFLRRTRPQDIGCAGGLWILPGTKVFFEARKKGYIDDSFWLSDEPYKVYTLEWPLEKLKEFEQRVFNYNKGVYMASTTEHQEQISPSRLQDKWNRYVHNDVNEYSSTSEWKDAQALHLELFKQIPESCSDVLDLGCGDGWSTYQLTRFGKRAMGVTSNDKEAAHAAEYGVKAVVQDMHDLKFSDRSFDLIYCREVLEHSVAPYLALCEMNRVLRPGGYALINLPWDEWIRDDSHFSVMTPPQMREMFYKTRFIVEKEGKSSAGHFWYLAKKVAEIGEPHPYDPPRPGEVWVVPGSTAPGSSPQFSPTKSNRPRVIGMMRIKNEERWIAQVLEKASGIVDGFVILDDGSTDRTPQICKSFPNILHYEVQQENTVDEARDKNKLLKLALSYNPEWILALDGDEVLEESSDEVIPALLASVPADVTVIGFDFLYMWDSEDLYRYDGKYCGINHPRLFRVKGNGIEPDTLTFKSTQHGSNFHCGSVPSNMPGRAFESDIRVKHYGYFEREQREHKKRFYVQHDPGQAAEGYYDHLTDEQGMNLLSWKDRKPEDFACLKAFQADEEAEVRRRFESLPQYYKHLRKEILNAVPPGANDILDVGCGAGILGKALKEMKPGRRVYGIELNDGAFFFARRNLDAAYSVDVESFTPPFSEGQLDCIIFADVLEHLNNPWEVLARFSKLLKKDGTVVISIPNIRYLGIMRDLAEHGKWEYQDEGILDRTHLRFFTRSEFTKLLHQAGIQRETVSYLGTEAMQQYRPQGPDRAVRIGNVEIHNVSDSAFDEMSAFQILFVGKYVAQQQISIKVEEADAYYREAQSLIELHEYEKAGAVLEAILAVIPNHPSLLNDLAVVKAQQGRMNEAVALLKAVLSVDPNNKVASGNLDAISRMYDKPPDRPDGGGKPAGQIDSGEAIARAEEFIQQGNYDDGEAALKSLLAVFPLNTDALSDLSVVYILTGRANDAEKVIKEILEIDPLNRAAQENLKVLQAKPATQKRNGPDAAGNSAARLTTERPQDPPERITFKHLPLASIIIPLFNHLDYTQKCIHALIQNTRYPNYEVILLDNASTDGTAAYIKELAEKDSRFRDLPSGENLGFVKGCNFASRQAKGEYVVFLNNDTEVRPGWLEYLVAFAETREDCGAIGSKLIYPDGTLQEAGGMIFSDGEGRNFGRGENPDALPYNTVAEVDYCSGASLMVRTALFMKYGGFDERYAPAYSEDADLCFRLRQDGYRVFYQPKSCVVHHESKTAGKDENSGFKKYLPINRRKLVEKWKEQLLLQDESPFDDKLVPSTADRRRLVGSEGQPKFEYRKTYLFKGLEGFPADVISYFPSLTPREDKAKEIGMFDDPDFLYAVTGRYGLQWLYGRAYLEGRSIRIHDEELKNFFPPDVEREIVNSKEVFRTLEPQQRSILRDILKLQVTPEPTRSLLFITSGGRKMAGKNALVELYGIGAKYALMKGVSDVKDGLPEDQGLMEIEDLIENEYTSRMELPAYVTESEKRLLRFGCQKDLDEKQKSAKVLCFYPHNPFPPRTGADHGFIGVLDALQELGCEVHLVSSTYFTDKPWRLREIKNFCREKNVSLYIHQADEEDNIHVRTMQLLGPSKRWEMKVPESLRSAFLEVYNEVMPDIVLVNYAWWGRLVDDPKFAGTVKVVQMHDLLSLNEKMQQAAHMLVGRPPYEPASVKPEAMIEDVFARLKLSGDNDEFEIYRRFDYVVGVSPKELEKIATPSVATRSVLIPAPLGNRRFVTGNTYNGIPLFAIANNVFNVQAYMYFVNKVLPLIRKELPDFELNVIGDGCKVLRPAEGVNLLGFVEDILALYHDAPFAIAPMIGGTGQSVKILEAMANGLPVVSLNNSYQTCSVRHGVDGFTANNAGEFSEYVIRLYRDRELCRTFGEKAREGITKDYSYDRIVEALKPVVEEAEHPRRKETATTGKSIGRKSRKPKTTKVAGDPEAVLKSYIERIDGNIVFVKDSIFDIDPVSPLSSIESFLNSLPPFYAHFGGIGDASLLLTTFYDDDPGQTIVSFANSKETMNSFFKSFSGIRKIYLMSSPSHAGVHQVLRFMIHRTRKCKGMGVAPLYEYGAEWNVNIDPFEKYKIRKNPAWIDRFKQNKMHDFQVAIQPKGSLKGMVGSKRNVINRNYWEAVITQLRNASIHPVILGMPDERIEYPALEGCIDKRGVSLKEQLEIVASSDLVIGADSWAKTFSALASVPTMVFRTVRGGDLKDWDDPADNVFIKPWESIDVVGDMDEFRAKLASLVPERLKTTARVPAPGNDSSTNSDGSGRKQGKVAIKWEGSQFVHHSMALINREVTLQLIDKGHDVSIVPYEKDEYNHRVDKRFARIARRVNKRLSRPADIHVRHQWPPNLVPPTEGHWVMIQPWEFGSLPKDWIQVMNESVDEVWVPSTFVRDCYIKSGMNPNGIAVVPNGVNTDRFSPKSKPYPLKTKKKFKFLFVGGTIARKGIDILLNAYVKAFKRDDDVCLVIKDLLGNSFYKGQTIEEDLKRISADLSLPEIEYINEKLSEEEIAGLYTAADCLVHPYRGEGFGLPIAEALSSELPVIVTNYGAALDFCSDENSYLIPSKVVYYEEKKIGKRETVDLPWLAEPDEEALVGLMRDVHRAPQEAKAKAAKGRKKILSDFTWARVGDVVADRMAMLVDRPIKRYAAEHASELQREYARAQALIDAGDLKGAAEILKSILNTDRDNIDAANDLAVVYTIDGNPADAERVLKELLTRHPESLVARRNLASIHMNQGRIAESVAIYQDILADFPFDIDSLKSLGRICVSLGKADEAREFLRIALQRDPGDEQAKAMLEAVEDQREPVAVK